MRRGTTPTFEFSIDTETSFIKDVLITFKQNDAIVLTKTKADCECNGMVITLNLTQEEANRFQKGYFDIQLRLLTFDEKVLASDPIKKYCGDVLDARILV